MHRAPDPRDRTGIERLSWRSVLAGYAVMAVLLLSLWAISHPVAGAAVIVAVVGLHAAARRAVRLARCLRVCREFTVDLGGRVRVTVTRTGAGDAG